MWFTINLKDEILGGVERGSNFALDMKANKVQYSLCERDFYAITAERTEYLVFSVAAMLFMMARCFFSFHDAVLGGFRSELG